MKSPDILKITSEEKFNSFSLKLFEYQYHACKVYHEFCKHFNKKPQNVHQVEEIPFLPIEFFKTHSVVSSDKPIKKTFCSSGTTGMQTSKHLVADLKLYEINALHIFEQAYGPIKDFAILALLPSYLERNDSSLVYMVNHFMKKGGNSESGFFLNNFDDLYSRLKRLESKGQKTLLIGVSFALLDFVETYQMKLKNTIVMETGGMKGRRKEMIRDELHNKLSTGFGVKKIHSEYGMTELLSQAYSKGNGIYNIPQTMKILIRDPEDPLTLFREYNKTGGINVIDLANINSCAFIATQDIGQNVKKNQAKIMGRFDYSDVRGCSLLTLS